VLIGVLKDPDISGLAFRRIADEEDEGGDGGGGG